MDLVQRLGHPQPGWMQRSPLIVVEDPPHRRAIVEHYAIGGGDHGSRLVRRRRSRSAGGSGVLDYCAAVRGILNDDQGGPLHPPGLRMAEALNEVQASIQRNLEAKKGDSRRSNWVGSRAASRRALRKSKSSKQ